MVSCGGRRQCLLNSIALSSQVPTSCANKSLDHAFRKLLLIVGVPSPHWLLALYGYCMSHFCGSVVHCNLLQCGQSSDVLNIEFVLNSVNAHPVELLSRFWMIIDVIHDAILLLVIVI